MKYICSILLILALALSGSVFAEMEIQEFPASADMYAMLDLSKPYQTVISGLFHQDIINQDAGIERECYVYIGASNHQQEANVTLIPDSSVDAVTFLETSGWKDIADEQGLILIIAQSEAGGWDIEKDLAYINQLWTTTHVRYYYNAQKHNSYALAYGDAATLGQMWAMQAVAPQKLVSVATFGNFEVDPAFIAETSAGTTRVEGVSVGDIEMPMWCFVSEVTENTQAVIDHWNAANNVKDEVLYLADGTAVYSARTETLENTVNDEKHLAQTRVSVTEDAGDYANVERNRQVWDFLSSVIRPVGFANNQLHPARTVEEWGAEIRELEVAGVNRYWVEYVPTKLYETEDGKVPMVVMFHGNNQGAETYLANSQAIRMAEDRGIIMLIMTGALYHDEKQMPNPMWNLLGAEDKFDDYAYVRAAIEDAESRLPVDTSRVYAMGLSYGSVAAQSFSVEMSDLFAACAPTSRNYTQDRTRVEIASLAETDTLMPLFLINGDSESYETAYDAEETIATVSSWLKANGLSETMADAETGYYQAGGWRVWTFANAAGIPLVQYGLSEGRIHTTVLDELYYQYDSFLSKWSRGEDGTTYYMGTAVSK